MKTINDVKWLMEEDEAKLSIGVMAANWKQLTASLKPFDAKKQWLHVDIMDGNFVPKITLGDWVCATLPAGFIVDVHLMVNNPLPLAIKCIDSGAHIITIQYESTSDAINIFDKIAEKKCTFNDVKYNVIRGVSLCPETDINELTKLLPHIELIQLLTLDPRTGKKMSSVDFILKLQSLVEFLDALGIKRLISVDGSMSLELAESSIKNKANIIVSGSAIFANNSVDKNLIEWNKILHD